MSDQDNMIALLEEYVLETDKERILESLVPNSVPYLIIKITNDMHKYGDQLPEESEKALQSLLLKGDQNKITELMSIKNLLMQLSLAKKNDKGGRV